MKLAHSCCNVATSNCRDTKKRKGIGLRWSTAVQCEDVEGWLLHQLVQRSSMGLRVNADHCGLLVSGEALGSAKTFVL
jgi:hypothetical protein